MSRLARQLVDQLGGRTGGLQASMTELLQRHGTVTAAARAAGVDRRTWQRWSTGKISHPKATTVAKVEHAVREGRAAGAPAGVAVQYQYDGRTRTPRFGGPNPQQLAPGTLDAMKSAYVAGDDEGVAHAFVEGVIDPWYHEQFEGAYAEDDVADGSGSDSSGAFV